MVEETEFQQAVEAGKEHHTAVPHATEVHYVADRRRLCVTLSNGVEMAIPVDLIEGLAGASDRDLAEIELTPFGQGLHWERLDADVLVEGLAQGAFGSKKWMASAMGRAGGSIKSASKAAAARENGKNGGRPRKVIS